MELQIHFDKHGYKFGLIPGQEDEYERMADDFLFGEMVGTMRECFRPDGIDRLRFCFLREFFGVACVMPEYIRTFYPPENDTLAKHGGRAPFFRYECARMST